MNPLVSVLVLARWGILLVALQGLASDSFAFVAVPIYHKHHHPQATTSSTRTTPTSITQLPVLQSLSSVEIDQFQVAFLQVCAVACTYVGLVTVFDRPRGNMLVEPDALEIKVSTVPNAGLGLFANVDLPKDTTLGSYPGVLVPMHQNLQKLRQFPACEGYTWRFSDNQFVLDPTDPRGVLQAQCRGGNAGLPGSQFLFQTLLSHWTVSTALTRINEPPKGKDVNVITQQCLESYRVIFSLERDVVAGEELFVDYGPSYDRSMYGDGGGDGNAILTEQEGE